MKKREILRTIRYPSVFLTSFITFWTFFFEIFRDDIFIPLGLPMKYVLIVFIVLDLIISILIIALIFFITRVYYLLIFPITHVEEFNNYIKLYIKSFREVFSAKGYLSKEDLKKINIQSEAPKIILKLLIKSFKIHYIIKRE